MARRARLAALLVEVMAADRYPAVRHLAWRAVRRMVDPDASPGSGFAAGYDPSGSPDDRRGAVGRLRGSLGTAEVPPTAPSTALGARARDRDLEMGE